MSRSNLEHIKIPLRDLEDGRYLEGDSGNPPSPPPDFDMTKFHRGRQFFREHIFSCSIGMFFSLIIGLCFPNLLETLVFTEYSNTPKKAFKRYIHTFRHVALWHYGNVWQEGTEAYESILFVRNLHRNVAQNMKKNNENVKEDRKYLSQYDMGVVQCGFMGLIVMYSYRIGINCSSSDIDDYVYFWYGIGHILGIDKKYNICAYGDSQAFDFCKDIEDILIENMKNPPPEFQPMAMAVIRAFRKSPSLTLFTLPAITSVSFDVMSRNQTEVLNVADNIRFYLWKFIYFLNRHIKCVRSLLRMAAEKAFDLTFIDS